MGSVFKYDTLVYSGYKLPTRPDHYGTDLHPRNNKNQFVTDAEILATSDQTIVFAGWTTSGWGNLVKTKDAKGFFHYYAHLSKINVAVGKKVKEGTVLGIIGTTGNSTGLHLHYEVRNQTDTRSNNGTVDPSPYCNVQNINGTKYPPQKGVDTPVYKMREYVFTDETMTIEEFYKAKANAPVEIMAVGKDGDKLKIARVVKATETAYALGKELPENHYLY